MKQWYTLYTKPRTEFRVAEALQERKLEVFLPEISVGKPELQNPQKAPFSLVTCSCESTLPRLRRHGGSGHLDFGVLSCLMTNQCPCLTMSLM